MFPALLLPPLLALAPQGAPPVPKAKARAVKKAPAIAPVPLSAEAEAVLAGVENKAKAIREALKAHTDAGKPAKDFKADVGPELAQVAERLKAENPVDVKEALLLARIGYERLVFQKPSPAEMEETRAGIRAISPVWKAGTPVLTNLFDFAKPEQQAYLVEAMEKNPAPEVRRAVLFAHFLDRFDEGDEAAWKASAAKLEKEHYGSKENLSAKRWIESATRTAPGKPAPAFAIAALGDPATTYNLEAFKGKYLMIDFWATWCGPCRAELPGIHKAYERFKDKNFEILSLSFDRKVDDIAPFRAKPGTPMPWKHAFVEGGFQSPLAKAFGVMGIPKPLLLGPDGRILAVESELRGDKLEKTLEKYLGN